MVSRRYDTPGLDGAFILQPEHQPAVCCALDVLQLERNTGQLSTRLPLVQNVSAVTCFEKALDYPKPRLMLLEMRWKSAFAYEGSTAHKSGQRWCHVQECDTWLGTSHVCRRCNVLAPLLPYGPSPSVWPGGNIMVTTCANISCSGLFWMETG